MDKQQEAVLTKGKKRRNVFLLTLEFLALFLAVGVLYVVTRMTNEVARTNIDDETIIINEEVAEKMKEDNISNSTTQKKGYRNIALFGVDARDGQLGKGTRSDSIIIASINLDTGDVKLVSVYRDTYLNLSNDSYNKCNTAYAQGGPEQAINMLNTNLDLNITDYATIGFGGLIDAIDALGGIDIEVTESEITHLNNYQLTMSEELDVDYVPVDEPGLQTLNGMQATAYCRIRYTAGDDFRRAERQRNVLGAMMVKAKSASLGSLNEAVTAVLPSLNTSLNVNEIISVAGTIADYEVITSEGFPFESDRTVANIGAKGSCIVPVDLEENVVLLHELLYEEEAYSPSKEVINISNEIETQTERYLN